MSKQYEENNDQLKIDFQKQYHEVWLIYVKFIRWGFLFIHFNFFKPVYDNRGYYRYYYTNFNDEIVLLMKKK